MQLSRFASPEAFKSEMSTFDAHQLLKSRVSVLSYTGAINIFGADGGLINSSGDWPLPAISIVDREYFKTFKSDPNLTTVLTEPVRSYYTGSWTTIIAHPLRGPDGVLLGVMVRRIEPANFEKFFASVTFGSGSAISMFHRDGTMLARYPRAGAAIGQNFKNAPLLKKVLTERGSQTLRVQSPVDHQDRLGAVAELGHYPIVIVATRTVEAALADWRAQTRFLITAAGLSALAIAFILFVIVRQIARQNRQIQQQLETDKHQLDTALNNMTQGLVLYDASGCVVLCNQRYLDMYGLSRDVVKPGCPYRDLIQHRKDTGSFDDDVDEFCSNVMRNMAEGKATQNLLTTSNGRSWQIVNKPLALGGWVATIEDITERRNLEEERDRNYAFLRQIIDHIPTRITVKDVLNHRYVLANRVAEAEYGQSSGTIVGKTAFDLFPKESAETITEDDRKARLSPDGLFLDERPGVPRAQPRSFHHVAAHRNPGPDRRDPLYRQRRRRRHRAPARRPRRSPTSRIMTR